MRAELSANPAMAANQRQPRVFVKSYGVHRASVLTAVAADAFMRVQQNTAPLPPGECVSRADFRAVRLPARLTYIRGELCVQASAGADMDAALPYGVIPAVGGGACQHAGKAPDALVQFVCSDYLCQVIYTSLRLNILVGRCARLSRNSIKYVYHPINIIFP